MLADIILWGTVVMMPLSIVANVYTIGKPREPLTPGTASVNILWAILLMGALLTVLLRP